MPKKQRERERRGDGTIYPIKKNGVIVRYAASISLGSVNGKRKRKTIYGRTEAEVSAELAKLRADLLRGIDIAPERLTVEQYLNAWLKSTEIDLAHSTQRIYRRAVHHITRHINSILLIKLKAEHVEAMLVELEKAGLAASTRKGTRRVLVTALNQAVERGYIVKNPARQAKVPKVPAAKVKALNEAQIARLNEAMRGRWIEPMCHISMRLGWRSGEVRGLLWSDINEAEMTIRVSGAIKDHDGERVREATKTGDETTVLLPAGLVPIFRARWKVQQQDRERAGQDWQESGLVFTRRNGEAFSAPELAHEFRTVARRANLPIHFTFHSLRHTCAAMMIKNRAQARQVMEVMRHKSIITTMNTYGHMFPEVTEETIAELDRAFSKIASGGDKHAR